MSASPLDQRPLMVAVTGPNGAGKTTFYHAHLKPAGLRLINADVLAAELDMEAYAAAAVAGRLRQELLRQRESFVFETVFSDPVGDKLEFLKAAAEQGYTVILCFIGISGPEVSEQRVAMRVTQGGHDVPAEKLITRYPRTLANLQAAPSGICRMSGSSTTTISGQPSAKSPCSNKAGRSPCTSRCPNGCGKS